LGGERRCRARGREGRLSSPCLSARNCWPLWSPPASLEDLLEEADEQNGEEDAVEELDWMVAIPTLRPRARLCLLRPRAEGYGPRPIIAAFLVFLFSSFVFLLFLKGFWLCFFTDFLDFYFRAGFFGFAGRFSNI
jgi:hypothetical protein